MFKIFVGNLDYKVRPEQVRELFAIYTPIEDLVLPTDPKTNKPRGFAIVMVRDPELGAAAIRGVQGRRLMGRELVVNEAIKKKGKGPAPPASPTRNGPFGPRMFQSADGRGRGNRNPRRSHGGASPRQAGAVGGTGSSKAVSGQPSSPPGSPSAGGGAPRASSAVGTSPPSQSPVPQGDPAAGAIRSSPPKAKPKLPPSAGLG